MITFNGSEQDPRGNILSTGRGGERQTGIVKGPPGHVNR
jgi:hypothetical protein